MFSFFFMWDNSHCNLLLCKNFYWLTVSFFLSGIRIANDVGGFSKWFGGRGPLTLPIVFTQRNTYVSLRQKDVEAPKRQSDTSIWSRDWNWSACNQKQRRSPSELSLLRSPRWSCKRTRKSRVFISRGHRVKAWWDKVKVQVSKVHISVRQTGHNKNGGLPLKFLHGCNCARGDVLTEIKSACICQCN